MDLKALPVDLIQIPNLPNQHKNRMKCLGSTEGRPRGRCTMGLASHSECLQTEMLVKKNRSSQRGEKQELLKKKGGRKGDTNTLHKKGFYGGTGQEMDSICISEKSLCFTYILKDFQPVLLEEIQKEEKGGQGEN